MGTSMQNINPDIPEVLDSDDFCCARLVTYLLEGKLAFAYNSSIRELQIYNKHYQWVHRIDFCPFCGEERPKSLYNEWCQAIIEVIGEVAFERGESFPEEFDDDRWWKTRNL